MKIDTEIKYDFCDVLIRPKRSQSPSRKSVDLSRSYTLLNSQREWQGIPIFASNMDVVGTFAMAEMLAKYGLSTCFHKYYEIDKLINFYSNGPVDRVFFTIGIKDEDFQKLDAFVKLIQLPDRKLNICIDVANGYTEFFVQKCKEVREKFPNVFILAGNVCTPEMVQELLLVGGVDVVKVGIGPGSVCTTRLATGVGYPQLSAIMECADAAHGLNGHICADGGCTTGGDVAKAFGAGADFVMLGGMLSGVDECEGDWEYGCDLKEGYKVQANEDGKIKWVKKALKFYGMSSKEAMDKYAGGVAEYRAAEGKMVSVPYKGPVKDVILEILGGLRSACTYVGTEKLKDFSKCCTFVRVNRTHNTVFGG